MTLGQGLLALLVALVWGLGFIAMKFGVADMPPLLFCAWRYAFAALPGVFFLRCPRAPLGVMLAYGLMIGVVQFSLLFTAIKLGIPAGLSSLLMQTQVVFTLLFAWLAMGERPRATQLVGVAVAIAGLAVIASARAGGGAAIPFVMVLGAAAAWGAGNIIGKAAGRVDMLAFTIWTSLIPPPVLFVLSMALEGGDTLSTALHPGWRALLSAAFLGYGATVLGYSLWSHLLSRHRAAEVAPYSLMVPVFGFLGGWAVFGERIGAMEWIGAVLILAGIAWNVVGGRVMAAFNERLA